MNNKQVLALSLLTISLLANAVFVYLYFFKFVPRSKDLKTRLESAEQQISDQDCKKVYSQSMGKLVCLTKSLALENCSKDFGDNLTKLLSENKSALSGIKSLDDLEKTRDLGIKICMQNQGFDY